MITTAGRLLLQDALPEKYRDLQKPIDSKTLTAILTDLATTGKPEEYVDYLKKLVDLGRFVATDYGRTASISLKDLKLPASVQKLKQDFKNKLYEIEQSDILTHAEKVKAMQELLSSASKELPAKLMDAALKENNAMIHAIISGARGGAKGEKMVQQMLIGSFGDNDSEGEYIPRTGLSGFAEGRSPFEYWAASYGTRKSNADVQLATAKVGYLARQLTNAAHRVIATSPDCGTTRGLIVAGDDPDNVGAILAKDVGDLTAGTVIREEHLPKLAGKNILVRSAITCDAAEGVCSKCSGIREHGKLPSLGEAVGINATRSFVEPLTQSAIGSKHAGTKISKRKTLEGHSLINQFMQMPKEFIDAAILTEKDGTVKRIAKAPQGGNFIFVDDVRYHVPEGVGLKVKVGDKVEAGDVLSEGIPNPALVVKYKGLGEGRYYFLNQLRDLLKNSNATTNRRNIELFTRGFISKAKITKPEGYAGYLIDDVVDYDTLAASWQPRPDSSLKSVTTAGNLYLEKPYLHYTIGTRVTPKVADTLLKAGIDVVHVHKDPPPFEPMTVRAQAFLSYDKDWTVRLAGEKLKSSLTAAAQRGLYSDANSTSYYPTLLNIADKDIGE
jgi:DNA-directed RNA polymerase subunit beta'